MPFQFKPTQLPPDFYTPQRPQPVATPQILVFNQDLADTLGLDPTDDWASVLSGNTVQAGSTPFAQAYAGHQFGHFTRLGDGRAVMLGEHVTPQGVRLDIQLKGAGPTPYARGGDGRAALGPVLREYLVSEAMHYLGIPTTRSLAAVSTGEWVQRDTALPGAILTRVAASHLRIGTVSYAALQSQAHSESLVQYALDRHNMMHGDDAPAVQLLRGVIDRQVDLIIQWMRVGFIHGVMNTDNTAISGETLDYGPCAFLDAYDPMAVFSAIDTHGRYAFGNQPAIAQWNCSRLAQALRPCLADHSDTAQSSAADLVGAYADLHQTRWLAMMRAKLGLLDTDPTDRALITDLLDWMRTTQADYTLTFRYLSGGDIPEYTQYHDPDFIAWHTRWRARVSAMPVDQVQAFMQTQNPAVIPRNHIIERVLAAAYQGDMAPFFDALAVFKTPYIQTDASRAYERPPHAHERVYYTYCGT